ncbi:MAG TPA: T9SS type A sorting domain-containing protein, partial [Bacteroidia bacterium]
TYLYGMGSGGGANNDGVVFKRCLSALVTATASSNPVCAGSSVTLTGGGAGSYVWSNGITDGVGFVPTSTSTYTVTGTSTGGCQSTATITVTVNQPTVSSHTITACDSYTLNAQTYTATGTYTQHVSNSKGCDSTITLYLTIHQPTASTLTATACSSYSLNAQTYTTTGTYIQHLTNSQGCDSAITLHLTINTVDTAVSQNSNVLTANASGAAYQWLDCNNSFVPIAGATGQSYTAATNGNFAVKITQNGCTDTSACYSISALGINNYLEDATLIIYPNPSSGIFTLRSNSAGNYSIVNELGQTVQTVQLNSSNRYSMSVEDLGNGIYFIVGYSSNHVIRQKVMVSK